MALSGKDRQYATACAPYKLYGPNGFDGILNKASSLAALAVLPAYLYATEETRILTKLNEAVARPAVRVRSPASSTRNSPPAARDEPLSPARATTASTGACGGIAEPWTCTAGIAAGTWISVFGSNFSPETREWAPVDGELLPASLAGVSLRVNGVAVPGAYVSPTLINGLVPAWVAPGDVTVQVERNGRASSPVILPATAALPGIYALPVAGSSPPRFFVTAALAGTGTLIGDRTIDTRVSRGARRGDSLDLHVVGLGRVRDSWITDRPFLGAFATAAPVEATLGGRAIPVAFAGLISPGLYLVRVTLPMDVPAGNQPLLLRTQGRTSRENVFLTVE